MPTTLTRAERLWLHRQTPITSDDMQPGTLEASHITSIAHATGIPTPTVGQGHERAQVRFAGDVLGDGFSVVRVGGGWHAGQQTRDQAQQARYLSTSATGRHGQTLLPVDRPFVASVRPFVANTFPVQCDAHDVSELVGTRHHTRTCGQRVHAPATPHTLRLAPAYLPIDDTSAPVQASTVGRVTDDGRVEWERTDLPLAEATCRRCVCHGTACSDYGAAWHAAAWHRAHGHEKGATADCGGTRLAYAAGRVAIPGARRIARPAETAARRRAREWAAYMTANAPTRGRKSACGYCGDCERCVRASGRARKRKTGPWTQEEEQGKGTARTNAGSVSLPVPTERERAMGARIPSLQH